MGFELELKHLKRSFYSIIPGKIGAASTLNTTSLGCDKFKDRCAAGHSLSMF